MLCLIVTCRCLTVNYYILNLVAFKNVMVCVCAWVCGHVYVRMCACMCARLTMAVDMALSSGSVVPYTRWSRRANNKKSTTLHVTILLYTECLCRVWCTSFDFHLVSTLVFSTALYSGKEEFCSTLTVKLSSQYYYGCKQLCYHVLRCFYIKIINIT